jgi:aquaporin-4
MAGCSDAVGRNFDDLSKPQFWKALLAELIGTMLLVFIGCASCVQNAICYVAPSEASASEGTTAPPSCTDPNDPSIVQISLTFGLAVATVVWSIAHVSGGHINPAVTAGMLFARKITIVKAILYVISQCLGAIIGAAILKAMNPEHLKNDLCPTRVSSAISAGQGFGVELIITFVLVFTVFASCDKARTDLNGSAPLTIGLSVTLCHLAAIKYTGASMNPARSFGVDVILKEFPDHWVYWLGPICGGIIAGLLYDLLFAADSSLKKVKYACCSVSGPEVYEFDAKHNDNNNNNNDNINSDYEDEPYSWSS